MAVTVRIPELPQNIDALSLTDRLPIWVSGANKTRYTTLQDLNTFFQTGGGSSYAPVYNGASVIYLVPVSAAGLQIASIPTLAGMTFRLRRGGIPLIQGVEYEILSAGGFELSIDGDILIQGERFELDVYELQAAQPSSPVASGGSLITGVVPIVANITLDNSHWKKLLQIRANNSIITITLPNVDLVPDNTVVIMETMITNNYQARITTTGGQFIYMLNTGKTSVYIGKSEAIWLYRGDDGWYVINSDFAKIYQRVGKIESSYSLEIDEVLANGALLQRTQHPRLWEKAQTFSSSLVSEATWNTASVTTAGRTVQRPFRGCYSTGDGSTTFRVPDLMNVALRGIKSESGTDTERHLNKAGGFQRHEHESHSHNVPVPTDKTSQTEGGNGRFVGGSSGFEPIPMNSLTTDATGGAETRMDNVGILYTIKC